LAGPDTEARSLSKTGLGCQPPYSAEGDVFVASVHQAVTADTPADECIAYAFRLEATIWILQPVLGRAAIRADRRAYFTTEKDPPKPTPP
ncbi:MAG: hypothetical protein D6711_10005, partial [Chloroflexi bacterium]